MWNPLEELSELRAQNVAMEEELGSLRKEKQAFEKLVADLEDKNKVRIAERSYLRDVPVGPSKT